MNGEEETWRPNLIACARGVDFSEYNAVVGPITSIDGRGAVRVEPAFELKVGALWVDRQILVDAAQRHGPSHGEDIQCWDRWPIAFCYRSMSVVGEPVGDEGEGGEG